MSETKNIPAPKEAQAALELARLFEMKASPDPLATVTLRYDVVNSAISESALKTAQGVVCDAVASVINLRIRHLLEIVNHRETVSA